MEPIKRKRVTRVGSGAYSIYLPKKWIDSWSPQQQEKREVDLHLISNSMLIAPVLQDRTLERSVTDETVVPLLLSAYVRGAENVRLRPQTGRFSPETVGQARTFLRRLDERLVSRCSEESVGFEVRPDLPPPAGSAADILNVLGAKVEDCLRLAIDAVESYGHEPDRALHAVRLLQLTHDEDVARLFHQTLRLVATIEIPVESVSDFQLLDLLAASMHRVGVQTERIGEAVLSRYNLTMADLEYPREHLLQQIDAPPPPTPLGRDMAKGHIRILDQTRHHLRTMLRAAADEDAGALNRLHHAIQDSLQGMQKRMYDTVLAHWGDEEDLDRSESTFTAYRASIPMATILDDLAATADHAAAIVAATPEVEA